MKPTYLGNRSTTNVGDLVREVIIPPVPEDDRDTGFEPQFIKKRSNNTGILYIGDLFNDALGLKIQTIQSLNNQSMFVNIKRLRVNKVILNENIPNVTLENRLFKGTIFNEPAHTVFSAVSINLPITRIQNITELLALFNTFINALHPQLTFTFIDNMVKMIVLPTYSFEFSPDSSFATNGESMFGLSPIIDIIGPTQVYTMTPNFKPFWYIDILSNRLTGHSSNFSISNTTTNFNILYRYYYGINNSAPGPWINWDKSGIASFDIEVVDEIGQSLGVYAINGSNFLAIEILMEQ